MRKTILALVLCLFAALLLMTSCKPDFVGNKITLNGTYTLDFSALNRTEDGELNVKAGEGMRVTIALEEGSVDVEIRDGDYEPAYIGNGLSNEDFTVICQKDGRYTISVTGENAKGKVVVKTEK